MGDEPGSSSASKRSSTSESAQQRQGKVDRFWKAMQQMYGIRWTTAYGETPSELWTLAIQSLLAKELKSAYRALLSEGSDHPPTMPKFMALARQDSGKKTQRFPEPHTAEWNELRKDLMARIAKQTRERGVTFTPAQREASSRAIALAELSSGMVGYQEALEAYQTFKRPADMAEADYPF